jgi:hypothetical protein
MCQNTDAAFSANWTMWLFIFFRIFHKFYCGTGANHTIAAAQHEFRQRNRKLADQNFIKFKAL